MQQRFVALRDPIALLLLLALIFEMLGAYTALAAYRNYLIFAGAITITIAFVFVPNIPQAIQQSMRYWTTIPALVYLGWTILLGVLSPYPSFARADMLRVFCGVMAYLLVTGNPSTSRNLPPLLITCGVLQIGYDFSLLGTKGGIGKTDFNYSAFATHQEVGSFLLLLLPLCISYLFYIPRRSKTGADETHIIHLASLGATLLFLVAFLIARCRSAWLGITVALFFGIGISAWYFWRYRKSTNTSVSVKDWLPKVAILAAILPCLVAFFFIVRGNNALSSRTATLAKWNDEIGDRWTYWHAGLQMAKERPLTGWGPGSYIVLQHQRTGIGRTKGEVLKYGAGHLNIAHSYYAQWVADTGYVGLLIHCSVIVAFGIAFFQAISRHIGSRDPLHLTLSTIIAGAAVLASVIDAIASPSYNYHAIFLLWWMIVGIGIVRFTGTRYSNQSQ